MQQSCQQTQGISDEEKRAAQRQTLTADHPGRTRPKVTPLVGGVAGGRQRLRLTRLVARVVIPSPSEPRKAQKAQVH